jgi:GTP-binding protein Era
MLRKDTQGMAEYRSGFVAVLGRPNVGKSTLINALLGQKIAPVSPRPQTTRRRQLGILTLPQAQIVFVDTPGIHLPRHKLGEFLNQEATEILGEVDVLLFLVDLSLPPGEEERLIVQRIREDAPTTGVILGLNKCDLLPQGEWESQAAPYRALIPHQKAIFLSATRGDGREELIQTLIQALPIQEALYPEDQVTDLYEREIAAELIREAALLHLRDEVPHALAVRIDEYIERNEHGAYIRATLFVERESQKGIVIGQGGSMLKRIGSDARREIEAMSGRKVFLELRVKTLPNWRNRIDVLHRLGYRIQSKKERS